MSQAIIEFSMNANLLKHGSIHYLNQVRNVGKCQSNHAYQQKTS
jgi:hypothetical protein